MALNFRIDFGFFNSADTERLRIFEVELNPFCITIKS